MRIGAFDHGSARQVHRGRPISVLPAKRARRADQLALILLRRTLPASAVSPERTAGARRTPRAPERSTPRGRPDSDYSTTRRHKTGERAARSGRSCDGAEEAAANVKELGNVSVRANQL